MSDEELRATSSAPWNPPSSVPSQEPWEFALRLPERIATLPLKAVGFVANSLLRTIEQRNLVERLAGPASAVGHPRFGFSVGAPHLGPGVGFGLAADFRLPLLDNLLSAELAGSTLKYTRTRIGLNHGPATLDFVYDWRPRDRFFGLGIASSPDSMSTFAWRHQRYQLTLTYPWEQPGEVKPRTQITGWAGPREAILHHGRHAPSIEEVFPSEAGILDRHQEHFIYGLQLSADTRAGMPHWGRGFLAQIQGERFDKAIKWLTIRNGETDAPQFTRVSFKGQTGFSFMRDARTIRLTVRAVNTSSVTNNAPLMIPDLASLGADDGLASLDLGRFRDRDLLYGAITYLFPMSKHLEMEIHEEVGGVYSRMRDARPSSFKNSTGFSLRPRVDSRILASIGADWSPGVFTIRYNLTGGE